MKQLLLLFAFLLPVGLASAQTTIPAKIPATTVKAPAKKLPAPTVYICEGGSAYAYHRSKNCSGLNRCTHTISAVSKTVAENSYDRRPCKKCF